MLVVQVNRKMPTKDFAGTYLLYLALFCLAFAFWYPPLVKEFRDSQLKQDLNFCIAFGKGLCNYWDPREYILGFCILPITTKMLLDEAIARYGCWSTSSRRTSSGTTLQPQMGS